MADPEDDKIPNLFATIHFRSDKRPNGYTSEDIAEMNIAANSHIPELADGLRAGGRRRRVETRSAEVELDAPSGEDVQALVDAVREAELLKSHRLSSSYYYPSIGQCVIDAVFSIGVKYSGTRAVVERWSASQNPPWELVSEERRAGKPPSRERTTSEFLALLSGYDAEELARQHFGNAQRTSTRGNSILKAEAVRLFAIALQRGGIERLRDTQEARLTDRVRKDVVSIPGQASGISWDYFLMLAGSDEHVKMDRMLYRFVAAALGWPKMPSPRRHDLARSLVVQAASRLTVKPRELDHAIWNYEHIRR